MGEAQELDEHHRLVRLVDPRPEKVTVSGGVGVPACTSADAYPCAREDSPGRFSDVKPLRVIHGELMTWETRVDRAGSL